MQVRALNCPFASDDSLSSEANPDALCLTFEVVLTMLRLLGTLTALILLSTTDIRLCGQVFADHADLFDSLASAERQHEAFYLRDVTVTTLMRTFDDKGSEHSTTKFKYIAGKDRFLLAAIEGSTASKLPQSHQKKIILGCPEGIFRITEKGPTDYIIRSSLPWTADNFYAACHSDFGITLPMAQRDRSLLTQLRQPECRIQAISHVRWFDLPTTKVSTYIDRGAVGGLNVDYYFESENDWLFRGSEVHNPKLKGFALYRVFYRPDARTPLKAEYEVHSDDKPARKSFSTEILEFTKEEHPDSEFSFSQFGLPEPVGRQAVNRGLPVYLWLLISACALGLLSLLLRILSRRKLVRGTPA